MPPPPSPPTNTASAGKEKNVKGEAKPLSPPSSSAAATAKSPQTTTTPSGKKKASTTPPPPPQDSSADATSSASASGSQFPSFPTAAAAAAAAVTSAPTDVVLALSTPIGATPQRLQQPPPTPQKRGTPRDKDTDKETDQGGGATSPNNNNNDDADNSVVFMESSNEKKRGRGISSPTASMPPPPPPPAPAPQQQLQFGDGGLLLRGGSFANAYAFNKPKATSEQRKKALLLSTISAAHVRRALEDPKTGVAPVVKPPPPPSQQQANSSLSLINKDGSDASTATSSVAQPNVNTLAETAATPSSKRGGERLKKTTRTDADTPVGNGNDALGDTDQSNKDVVSMNSTPHRGAKKGGLRAEPSASALPTPTPPSPAAAANPPPTSAPSPRQVYGPIGSTAVYTRVSDVIRSHVVGGGGGGAASNTTTASSCRDPMDDYKVMAKVRQLAAPSSPLAAAASTAANSSTSAAGVSLNQNGSVKTLTPPLSAATAVTTADAKKGSAGDANNNSAKAAEKRQRSPPSSPGAAASSPLKNNKEKEETSGKDGFESDDDADDDEGQEGDGNDCADTKKRHRAEEGGGGDDGESTPSLSAAVTANVAGHRRPSKKEILALRRAPTMSLRGPHLLPPRDYTAEHEQQLAVLEAAGLLPLASDGKSTSTTTTASPLLIDANAGKCNERGGSRTATPTPPLDNIPSPFLSAPAIANPTPKTKASTPKAASRSSFDDSRPTATAPSSSSSSSAAAATTTTAAVTATSSRPYTIVLDLDETVVYARDGPLYARAHLRELLLCMHAYAEVVVWTAGEREYAKAVLEEINTDHVIQHLIYRHKKWFDEEDYTKDLTMLGRDMRFVLIVENTPDCVRANPLNGIIVEDYEPSNTALDKKEEEETSAKNAASVSKPPQTVVDHTFRKLITLITDLGNSGGTPVPEFLASYPLLRRQKVLGSNGEMIPIFYLSSRRAKRMLAAPLNVEGGVSGEGVEPPSSAAATVDSDADAFKSAKKGGKVVKINRDKKQRSSEK